MGRTHTNTHDHRRRPFCISTKGTKSRYHDTMGTFFSASCLFAPVCKNCHSIPKLIRDLVRPRSASSPAGGVKKGDRITPISRRSSCQSSLRTSHNTHHRPLRARRRCKTDAEKEKPTKDLCFFVFVFIRIRQSEPENQPIGAIRQSRQNRPGDSGLGTSRCQFK